MMSLAALALRWDVGFKSYLEVLFNTKIWPLHLLILDYIRIIAWKRLKGVVLSDLLLKADF